MLEFLYGGCELAKNIGAKLASDQMPTEDEILPNVGRFSDPAVDEAVKQLAGATDPAEQKKYLDELIDVMMTEFPVTALIYAPSRIAYRTEYAVGWPSEEDPYANGADDRLLVLTHLRPPDES